MRLAGAVCVLWLAARMAPAAEVYTYWIQPCAGELAAHSRCRAADAELARWALEAWQKAGGSGFRFAPAEHQDGARICIYWLGGKPQLYGDAHVVFLNGKRVWVVEAQPDLAQFGPRIAAAGKDDVFRDAVVYLTCLHEIGHVLGMAHTDDFTDIMYSFQYGGDVLDYFSRYRRTLKERADIREHSGISERERERVARLYADR